MKFNQSQKNIPNGWQQVVFGEIADPKKKWSFTGGPFGSNLKQSSYVESGIRIIQLQNIGDGEFIDDYKIFTTKEKADELLSCNIYPGEIILSKMGDPVARACLIPNTDKRYLMASDGIRLSPDDKRFNTYFIFLAINSRYFRTLAENSSTGSTRRRIGLSVLRKLELYIPELLEQNRIVSVLETWDQAIEKLTKKIEIKKQIKKGLMQDLLTGKKRLSGFKGEWEAIKLGDLCEIKRGGSPRPIEDYITNDADGLNWLRIGDVPVGDRYIYKTSEKIKKEGLRKTTFVNEGDFILSNSMSFGRPYIMKTKACIHDGWLALMNISSSINKDFLYYLLSSSQIQSIFNSISAGSGVQNLKKETVSEVVVNIPKFKEQTCIANILSSADNEIGELEQKLSLLKDQKKYLLNNLITGNIRTPEDLLEKIGGEYATV